MAEAAGALVLDPVEVIDAAATKPYGFMPFYPGPGVGGHCIPCDPHYLLWQLRDERMYPAVISAAMQGIATRTTRIVQRAAEVLDLHGRALRGAAVLVVGAAYKPNVADSRESPALEIISRLRCRGALVALYDPLIGGVRIDGELLLSLDELPDMRDYDLVVVACRHDITPPEAFAGAKVVLDTTYRLPAASNRFVP